MNRKDPSTEAQMSRAMIEPDGLEGMNDSAPEDRAIRGSIAWLVAKYLAAQEVEVEREEKRKGTGIKRSTFRERSLHLGRLCEKYGEFSIAIPQAVLIEYRDSLSAKPAAADGMIKTIRAMYSWAVDRGLSESNPAKEILAIVRFGYQKSQHHEAQPIRSRRLLGMYVCFGYVVSDFSR